MRAQPKGARMMLFLGTGNSQRFERAHGKAAVRHPRTLPDFYGHFLTLFLTLPFQTILAFVSL